MTSLQIEAEVQQPSRQASPAVIFEALHRYQQSMALKGAIDLELFTHIARGAVTAGEIAKRCQANERGVRILCDFLTVMGFLHKSDGVYSLSRESSVFLDKQSPAYMGTVTGFLCHPRNVGRFQDVAELVRNGGPADGAGHMSPDNDIWVEFATSMVPMVILAAQGVAKAVADPGRSIKVLDIAAGHGMFGISIARSNPAAEIVAADWKNVLKVATTNATRAGVLGRFHTIAGNVLEVNLGTGYDLVVISNFLHCLDAAANLRLLKKVHAALKPGGQVATVEFLPNEDRVSPPLAASFALNMLGGTKGGDVYPLRELDQMFRAVGLGDSRVLPLDPTPLSLILTGRELNETN